MSLPQTMLALVELSMILTGQPLERPLTPLEARTVLVVAGWHGEHLEDALAVAECESTLQPHVIGDGGSAMGLFQIHWCNWTNECLDGFESRYPNPLTYREWGKPLNAVHNAYLARIIFHRSGWNRWTCQPDGTKKEW